jgi:dTDP-glucose pyrophosphorylase
MIDIEKFTVSEKSIAKEALQLINKIAIPNLAIFIVDEEKKLAGSITDGDIRRGLLDGLALDAPISKFMNKTSRYFIQGQDNFEKGEQYKKAGIRFVPVLDQSRHIVRIIDLQELRSIIPAHAVLMAGGRGERLKPLTDTIPKPMLKIGERPIVIRNLERLASFGISDFHIAVRYLAEQIKSGIGEYNMGDVSINYIEEDKPLGTIGALKLIKKIENDTILLMNSDLLTNIDFHDFYRKFITSGADMQVATVPYHVDVPYAIMEINDKNEVLSFSEKPRYTYYSNAGIYLFKKELINLIPDDTIFDATHFMEAMINHKKQLLSYPILSYWLDIGRIEDFYKAQEDIKHIHF